MSSRYSSKDCIAGHQKSVASISGRWLGHCRAQRACNSTRKAQMECRMPVWVDLPLQLGPGCTRWRGPWSKPICQGIKGPFDARKRKRMFSGVIVQLPIVNAHAETAIFPFNKYNERRVVAAALPKDLCLEQFVNMLLHNLLTRRNVPVVLTNRNIQRVTLVQPRSPS